MYNQNDLEYIKDMMERENMTADQANVELVRLQRVRVIEGSMPATARKALNDAVKSGKLGHKSKNGLMPEVYYHPNFEHLANGERSEIARKTINAISKVCC